MLRITPKEQDAKLTLSLEGKLAGPWVAELAKAWSEWQGRVQPRDAVIDLRLVSFVDEAGRELLVQLHLEGCALLGSGCYVGPLVDSIIQGRETGAAPAALVLAGRAGPGLPAGVGLAAASPDAGRRRCPSPSTRPCAPPWTRTPRSTARCWPSPRARRTAGRRPPP